jgi:hypothetical protein
MQFQELGTDPPAGEFVLGVNIAWLLRALHIETQHRFTTKLDFGVNWVAQLIYRPAYTLLD